MQRLLITGGAGFIGSHVAQEALAAGFQVSVLDTLVSGRLESLPVGVTVVQTDLRDREGVMEAVRAFAPDVISHHAAQISVSESVKSPQLDAEVNVVGTLNLLEAARSAQVRRFVFASSGGAIQGEVPEGEVGHADGPARPVSPYGVGKLAVEGYLYAYQQQFGLEASILRYANVYGPRQSALGEAGVVAVFMSRLLAGHQVQINARDVTGDDGGIRDYVYVGDVARINLRAATASSGELPPILNVATGEATSTRALADLIGRLAEVPVLSVPAPRRSGDVRRSVLDASVCAPLLGGKMTPLEQGLAETLAWYRHPAPVR